MLRFKKANGRLLWCVPATWMAISRCVKLSNCFAHVPNMPCIMSLGRLSIVTSVATLVASRNKFGDAMRMMGATRLLRRRNATGSTASSDAESSHAAEYSCGGCVAEPLSPRDSVASKTIEILPPTIGNTKVPRDASSSKGSVCRCARARVPAGSSRYGLATVLSSPSHRAPMRAM